jgi:hypothetical protein
MKPPRSASGKWTIRGSPVREKPTNVAPIAPT